MPVPRAPARCFARNPGITVERIESIESIESIDSIEGTDLPTLPYLRRQSVEALACADHLHTKEDL
jgi:hypothetical protein